MFNLLISNAYAEAAAPAQQSPIMSMIPLVLVFMVFYFLMLRPQKKKMEEERKYVAALQKGEEVYTKSGIIGTIYGVTEKVITLDVGDGNKMKILKSHVAGSTKDIFEVKQPANATPAKK
jgi:preprotein translocase subunit YajC